jgi:hypothetical protein
MERAVALLRDHDELAFQRYDELRRHHRNQVGPLSIAVCRGCLEDLGQVGHASSGTEAGGFTGCDIAFDLAGAEESARAWGLPLTQVTASVLVHEQEHCIRDPDDRETPAIDEERRLAQKVGNPRLVEYVNSEYSLLDRRGYWKS